MNHKLQAYNLLHEGILTLARIEQNGLRVDVDYVKRKKKEINERIDSLETEIYESKFFKDWEKSAGKKVNIYSPVQLSNFLYKVKKYKIPKETETGQGSTDKETLKRLDIEELDLLLKIKELKKIRDTYLTSLEREQVNGVMHPFYNLHNVRSYRSSCSSPNFQNIPKRDKEAMQIIRSAIYPRKGHLLLEVDYSQLEVRIAACYTKDERLIKDVLEGDMHRDMAMEIFKLSKFDKSKTGHSELRGSAKNGFVFPQFYGDYYRNCADLITQSWLQLPKTRWKTGQGIDFEDRKISDHLIDVGLRSYTSFENHLQEIEEKFWGERYTQYAKWKEVIWKRYQKRGYVTCKTGFNFRGLMSKNDVTNYPIQASAFHCLLWSLIEIDKAQRRGRWDSRVVGQIHDAIIFDVHPDELEMLVKVVKCIMCNDVRQHWNWIIVPLEIEGEICPLDGSWAEKEFYQI